MSAIYKIIGQDGREYGPVTAEQIQQWISEGRIECQTPVFVDGAKDWSFVGLMPEFAGSFAVAGKPPLIAPLPRGEETAGRQARTNAYAQVGMIFGILSVACCCGFPFGVLGLVFSLIGWSQINANPDLHEGRGMAIAGVILSLISLLLGAGWMFANLVLHQPHIIWNTGRF